MVLRASWSRSWISSLTASSLARVRSPRSRASSADVVVSARAPPWIDTSARVAHLGTEVVPMELAQLVAGDAPQPEEKGHRGLLEIRLQVPPGFQIRILHDVGGIDAPLEAPIKTECDHAAQPLATLADQGLPAAGIAGGGPQELIAFARFLGHRGDHRRGLAVDQSQSFTPEMTYLPAT